MILSSLMMESKNLSNLFQFKDCWNKGGKWNLFMVSFLPKAVADIDYFCNYKRHSFLCLDDLQNLTKSLKPVEYRE